MGRNGPQPTDHALPSAGGHRPGTLGAQDPTIRGTNASLAPASVYKYTVTSPTITFSELLVWGFGPVYFPCAHNEGFSLNTRGHTSCYTV